VGAVIRLLLLVSAAAVLLAGCGGQPHAHPSTPATTSTTGTLVVSQQGDAPEHTLWYVRIENLHAEPLVEKSFPAGPIRLTKALRAGRYRVISWYRECSGTCPTTGEHGLGPLEQVCGAVAAIKAGAKVTARVTIGDKANCSVRIST